MKKALSGQLPCVIRLRRDTETDQEATLGRMEVILSVGTHAALENGLTLSGVPWRGEGRI